MTKHNLFFFYVHFFLTKRVKGTGDGLLGELYFVSRCVYIKGGVSGAECLSSCEGFLSGTNR